MKDIQIGLAATNSINDSKDHKKQVIPATSALGKKKDRLLKDFMKRQLQMKKSLDKMNDSLNQERQSKLALEKRLNSANVLLDQWKDKCSVLAAANTKMKNESTLAAGSKQRTNSTQSSVNPCTATTHTPASIKLSPWTISSTQKTASSSPATVESKPQVTTSVSSILTAAKDAPAARVVMNSTQTPAPINDTQIAEVVSEPIATEAKNSSGETAKTAVKAKISAADAKLTRINGIGPAIETALKKLGIKSIQQMAELKKQDIKELDKQLGKYSGRIQRQQWVKQAKNLAETSEQQTEAA